MIVVGIVFGVFILIPSFTAEVIVEESYDYDYEDENDRARGRRKPPKRSKRKHK